MLAWTNLNVFMNLVQQFMNLATSILALNLDQG
jgi:hypothetical protein